MTCGVAEVTRRDQPVGSKLSLDAQVVLPNAHVRRVVIVSRCNVVELPRYVFRRVSAGRNHTGISAGVIGPGIGEIDVLKVGTSRPGRHGGSISEVECRRVIIENPRRRANRSAAVSSYVPREAQARGKVPPVLV